MARVSAVIDTIKSTEKQTSKEIILEISEEAKQKAVEAGASEGSVEIVEVEALPLQYVADKTRFIVRAAGEFDFARSKDFADLNVTKDTEVTVTEPKASEETSTPASTKDTQAEDDSVPEVDIESYRPNIVGREWFISETDLQWITIGCYILGTGGGGSPYSTMLRVRGILRAGGIVRVVNPDDLKDDDRVGSGGSAGSPTVGIEKLSADE
jgi:hypothetical protein